MVFIDRPCLEGSFSLDNTWCIEVHGAETGPVLSCMSRPVRDTEGWLDNLAECYQPPKLDEPMLVQLEKWGTVSEQGIGYWLAVTSPHHKAVAAFSPTYMEL